MNRTITHKHLKRQFDIFEDTGDLNDFFAELQFSTLLLPVDIKNDSLSFPILSFEDKKYAPVFTDIHEYNKCNFPDNFTIMPNDFNFYINLLNERIDGIIIDVEGERFPITKDVQEFLKGNPISEYDSNASTINEVKQIKQSIDNGELDEFLKDESNHWDFESLIELLFKSDLLNVVLSNTDLSGNAHDGVISLNTKTLPSAISKKFTESYALIYSSENEVKPKRNPMHPYLQIVNLALFVNRVLLDDLDGIILNENSQNITIPRDALMNFMKDFDSPIPEDYSMYAFTL